MKESRANFCGFAKSGEGRWGPRYLSAPFASVVPQLCLSRASVACASVVPQLCLSIAPWSILSSTRGVDLKKRARPASAILFSGIAK